jgi:hypothetical protein
MCSQIECGYKILSGTKVNLLPFLPRYASTKFNPFEYIYTKESDVYSVNSFNEFGDVDAHWTLEERSFSPFGEISSEFNNSLLDIILAFEKQVAAMNGTLFLSFPGFQEKSFFNQKETIDIVYDNLKRSGLSLLGSPERYKMSEEYLFNSPYHLNKKGVDYRTELLIEDSNFPLEKSRN